MSVYRLPFWLRKFLCTFFHGYYRRLYFSASSKLPSVVVSSDDDFEELNW